VTARVFDHVRNGVRWVVEKGCDVRLHFDLLFATSYK
jgi:hypothetical protein